LLVLLLQALRQSETLDASEIQRVLSGQMPSPVVQRTVRFPPGLSGVVFDMPNLLERVDRGPSREPSNVQSICYVFERGPNSSLKGFLEVLQQLARGIRTQAVSSC
jgi:hypothetical protein